MKVSQKGVDFIKSFEGLKLNAYLCPAGVPTIGYGTTKYPNGDVVKLGDRCTEEVAESWLFHEIVEKCSYLNQVIGYLNLKLEQCEYDALASIIYNCGAGILKEDKSLGKALYARDKKEIAEAFLAYNKITVKILGVSIKKVSNGLDKRRKAEKALFEGKV